MGELLPDGTYQGYFNICPICKKTIEVNMQGNPINHKCEEKYFMWYDSDRRYGGPTYGPHYYGDYKLIGQKLYHPLSDLLKISLSDALKKRLTNAKVGTCIKIHYLHSCGNLMVKRIDESEIEHLNIIEYNYKEINLLDDKISELKKENIKLFSKLFAEPK